MTEVASYSYRAARHDGRFEVGEIEAPSRQAASTLLSARGLFPVEIQLETSPESGRTSLPPDELAFGLHMLATMLQSGLPISRALQALEEVVSDRWTRGLASVRASVREGKGLAAALRAAPLSFPPLVIGIIRAGEAGSGLAEAVRRAGDMLERQAATRAALRAALAYPVILAAAGAASVALLAGVVLPRFAVILADLGQSLPATTRFVLGASEFSRAAALPAVALAVVLLLSWRGWIARRTGRLRWHRLLLAAPVLGPIRRSAATARACAALAALLEGGVSIAPALLHAAPASGDAAVEARLLAAREAILRGQRIASALEAERALTPTAVRLVRTGEETGRLAELLSRAGRIESEFVERRVRNAVRLIEPLLIIAFGAVVALVAASLLQAVYTVRPVP